MRRFTKVALWGGLTLSLAVGTAPAQFINEIVRGAANGFADDVFMCGNGNAPCGLGYKMFCDLDPADTGGAANPVDGIPAYRSKAERYLVDTQITGNYPVCGGSGGGNNWYILWDGQTGGGTAAHAGWYGVQSQRINYNEIGNSLSFNCLPVIAAEACFPALDELSGKTHGTTLADGSALKAMGGISPVPVPQFEARLDSIAAIWTKASNENRRDMADPGLKTVDLLWMDYDPSATDMDWAMNGQLLATVPAGATEFKMSRTDPFIRDGKTFMLASRLNYVGGYSSYFSANSGTFNETQDLNCVDDPMDAPAVVDIEEICFSVRVDDFGKEYLVVLLDIVGDPLGQVKTEQIQYEVTMNTTGDPSARNNRQVRARAINSSRIDRRGAPVVLRFNTNFDNTGDVDGLLSEASTFDEAPERGWIMFGIPLSELAESFGGGSITGEAGSRTVLFTGRVNVPGAQDTFGELSYTF